MKPWLRFSLGFPVALMLGAQSAAVLASGIYISPAGQSASSADVGIDSHGNAFFSWTANDPVTQEEVIQLREKTAAGVLGAPETLSRTGHDAMPAHLAVDGSGDAVVVWQIHHGDASTTTPVQARARTAGGSLGPLFTVAPHPGGPFSFDFANPSVALDEAGNATFTWAGLDSNQKHRVYARRRAAGATLGPVFRLSPPGVSDVRMAVNANGATVFVWVWNDGNGHNLIEARQLSAGGALGPIRIIGQGIEASGGGGLGTGNPQVALDGPGNALIVWEQPDGTGPCGINGCPKVLARTLSNGGVVGSVPQTFTTTTSGGFSPLVAMGATGNAVVTWLHGGLEVRARAASGTLGPLQHFTTSTDAAELVLKGDPAGKTVAVWRNVTVIQARARSAAGILGAPRSFSIGGQAAFGGVLAVGTSGNAIAAWGQSDGFGQCFGGTSCNRIGAAVVP